MLHPAYRRWMLDADYLDQLSPEEQRWYAQFTDEHYAADFRYEEPLTKELADKRAAYGRQNANYRDLTSWAQAGQKLDAMPEDAEATYDATPTPEYLKDLEYADVVAQFRELVDTPKRSPAQDAKLELLQTYLLSIARSETVPGDRYIEEDEE